MDAVKFLKARKRMCDSFIGCSKCPVYNKNGESCFTNNNYEDMVKAVEEWANAHRARHGRACFWSSGRRQSWTMWVCLALHPAHWFHHFVTVVIVVDAKTVLFAAASSGCRRWSDG